MTFDAGGILLAEPPRGPLTCDLCGRFVAVRDAAFVHEFGDYGSILSTEVLCPRCNDRERFWQELADDGPVA